MKSNADYAGKACSEGMDISLSKLRHLVMVAKSGSLSRAAEELNLSQPALSRSIAGIEDRYGVRIFDRGRAGATLTASGAQIVEEAERLLRGARILDHNLRLHGRGEAGEVSIGMGPLVSTIVLPELGKHMFASRSNIRMRTLIRPTDVLVQALIDDEIELLLGPGPLDFPSEIEAKSIGGRVSAAFIVRASHPLSRVDGLELEDILRYPLACSVEIPWAQREGLPAAAFVCDNFHIIREMIADSDLIWVCPRHFVSAQVDSGLLSVLKVKSSPLTNDDSPFAVSEVLVGRLRGRTMSPLAAEVVAFCEAYFAERPHIR